MFLPTKEFAGWAVLACGLLQGVTMINDTSAMDRTVARPRGLSRRVWVAIAAGALLLLMAVLLYPSLSRWAVAERSIELSRVRLGPRSKLEPPDEGASRRAPRSFSGRCATGA